MVRITKCSSNNVYGNLGEWEKLHECLKCILVINVKRYGPDHPEVKKKLVNLTVLHTKLWEITESSETH